MDKHSIRKVLCYISCGVAICVEAVPPCISYLCVFSLKDKCGYIQIWFTKHYNNIFDININVSMLRMKLYERQSVISVQCNVIPGRIEVENKLYQMPIPKSHSPQNFLQILLAWWVSLHTRSTDSNLAQSVLTSSAHIPVLSVKCYHIH